MQVSDLLADQMTSPHPSILFIVFSCIYLTFVHMRQRVNIKDEGKTLWNRNGKPRLWAGANAGGICAAGRMSKTSWQLQSSLYMPTMIMVAHENLQVKIGVF